MFNNTYKKPETPVPTPDPGTPKTVTNIVKTVKGFLPTTGDQQAAALLSSCMAEGMAYSSPVTCTKGHPAMLCSVCSVMRSRVVSIATPR